MRDRITPPRLALNFTNATSDRMDCGVPAGNLTALTFLAWVYPTSLVATRRIYNRGLGVGTAHAFHLSGTSGDIEFVRSWSTGSSNVVSNDTPLATVNRWYCVACTLDAAASQQARLFAGHLGKPLAEVGGYSTNANGSGTLYDDSANTLMIGNRFSATFNQAFPGYIAMAARFDRVLSVPEMRAWMAGMHRQPGNRGLWYLGNEGAAKVLDRSGFGLTGTVTGATVTPGVPLAPIDVPAGRIPAGVA